MNDVERIVAEEHVQVRAGEIDPLRKAYRPAAGEADARVAHRLERERRETAKDGDAAVAAWTKWYAEAVAAAARLSTEK